jgi:hypothetical protein
MVGGQWSIVGGQSSNPPYAFNASTIFNLDILNAGKTPESKPNARHTARLITKRAR